MLFGRYLIECCFENEAILPYFKGSTFRGVFGIALKRVVCALKQLKCEECLLHPSILTSFFLENIIGTWAILYTLLIRWEKLVLERR